MKYIIIDGNNLIHKIPELKNLFYKNPESAHITLYEKAKSITGKDGKLLLVFDGFGTSNKNVIYSGKLTADEIIRRFIEENYERNAISVISSDNYITSLAKACGCEVIKSESFLKTGVVQKTGGIKSKGIPCNEKPEHVTKKEIAEFKKLFSE
jgi:predicted RNA-binding protein with PIN domain